MAQMRRIEFPKIVLTTPKAGEDGQPLLDDKGQLIRQPVKAQDLHRLALAKAGAATGYEGLRLHLRVSAAIESAKDSYVLLEEDEWQALMAALESYKAWPWYHDDVLRVIDAAKEAEKVEVDVTKKQAPNRQQRRAARVQA